jgi:hypothetical protein
LKSKTQCDHDAYIEQNKLTTKLIKTAKEQYYQDKLNSADCKTMFATLDKLLNKTTKQLPECSAMADMCNSFATFFNEKVTMIRRDLDTTSDTICSGTKSWEYCNGFKSTNVSLSEFCHVTIEDVCKFLMSMPSKSCPLDTIPIWLFKENVEILVKPLMSIINQSFRSGRVPSKIREALVTPILKKPTLDKEVLKNYRPVSNISYVSKIMEKIVCSQIKNHLNQNALQEPFQSAYRELHSTETALLRVKSDIMHAIDDNKAVAVVLLDLSAAFDTVDHLILLNRLSHTFGIRGKALAWISSYLKDRSFRVCTGDVSSSKKSLSYGIPQGSVVGPLFFVLYTCCLGTIIRKYNICYHMYADDVQLYLSFDPKVNGAAQFAISQLSTCISEISEWMRTNKLKLNDEKTEFFIASSDYNSKRRKT